MLGLGRRASSHFAKDEAKLAALLSDAKRFKGESLWQDAWRRLKRNRGAFLSLLFLIFFMGLSLIAPVLPVPSPMALDLVAEPQPPNWPWEANPRLAENLDPARKAKRFGLYSTEAKGAFADNGWQHRSFIDLVRPMAPGETEDTLQPAAEVSAFVQEISGRKPIVYVKPGEEPGTVLERHAVVYQSSDRSRIRYVKGEQQIPVRLTQMLTSAGTTAIYAEWLLPGEPPLTEAVEELGYTNEGVVGVTLPEDPTELTGTVENDRLHLASRLDGKLERRFSIALKGADTFTLEGARVAWGDEWPTDDEAWRNLLEPPAEPESAMDVESGTEPGDEPEDPTAAEPEEPTLEEFLALARLWTGEGGSLQLVKNGKRSVAFSERTATAQEFLPEPGLGLRAKAEEALEAGGLVATLASVDHIEGTWDLNWFDRQLVKGRAALFGSWQTGPLLGTDGKGRDLLSRIVWGSRISIQASLIATLFSLIIGVTYGAFSGLMGGRIDNLMMRIVDVLYAVPFIFVVIFLLTMLSEMGVDRMKVFYVVIGAIYWLTMARVVRGQVLSLKNQEFVESAKVLGASTSRILFVHLVPNVLSIVIVYMTLTIPQIMLFEAFLSFLGLGVEAPQVSWGLLATDGTEAISAIKVFWWVVLFPALAMGATLLSLSILGDGLRDALDPKLRGKD